MRFGGAEPLVAVEDVEEWRERGGIADDGIDCRTGPLESTRRSGRTSGSRAARPGLPVKTELAADPDPDMRSRLELALLATLGDRLENGALGASLVGAACGTGTRWDGAGLDCT